MTKEIEMAAGTDYIIPLSDDRRLIVGREVDGGQPGAYILLQNKIGDVYDMAVVRECKTSKGKVFRMYLWSDIFDESPTHEGEVNYPPPKIAPRFLRRGLEKAQRS